MTDTLELIELDEIVDFELKCESRRNTCDKPAAFFGKHQTECVMLWCTNHATKAVAHLIKAQESGLVMYCIKCGAIFQPVEGSIQKI